MTRASDLAKLLGAGATILDGTTITTADNTTQLTLTSTDADAINGPNLDLIRDSSSPADGDNLGRVRFYADNDANESTIFTQIYAGIEDASDGTEDGHLKINTIVAGTGRNRLSIIPSETVFNEDSVDVDFRVESNDDANMFFVDAGNNRIGVRKSAPDTAFHMGGGSDNYQMVLQGNTVQRLGLQLGTDSRVFLGAATGNHFRVSKQDAGALFDVNPSGNIILGQSGAGIHLGVTSATSSNLLDDYEEGTWTPALSNGGTIGTTYGATYTKIGNTVIARVYLNNLTIPNDSNEFRISGLPFTVRSGSYYGGLGAIIYVHSKNIDAFGMGDPVPYSGATIVYFHRRSGTTATVVNSDVTGMQAFIFGISYEV